MKNWNDFRKKFLNFSLHGSMSKEKENPKRDYLYDAVKIENGPKLRWRNGMLKIPHKAFTSWAKNEIL